MKGLDYTALTLVIIGAINWGLIGLFPAGSGQSAFWKYDLALPSRLHTGRHLRPVSLKPLRKSHRNGIRADVRTHGKELAAKIIAAAPLM